MNIAFVNTEYLPVPPVKGGAVEEWIERTAQRLTDHSVWIMSVHQEASQSSETKGHITYHWFKPGWLSKLLLCSYRLPFKKDSSKWLYFPYSFWCAVNLKKFEPDIIHIHNRPHFVWILKKMNPKAKIVLHIHQLSAMDEKNLWSEDMINSTSLFLGCSQFVINELVKRFPAAQGKTGVAYNGVDTKIFYPKWLDSLANEEFKKSLCPEGSKLILYSGRLAENKGVHLLVHAVKNLVHKGNRNIKLVVCGARGYANKEVTPYIQKLYDMAKGLESNIEFKGFIPHSKMPDYYRAADCIVIPSEVAEGFGVISIESLACGTGVIASPKGGIPEAVSHKHTGILLKDVSSPSIEEALLEFMEHFEPFQIYARNGHDLVHKKFTWTSITQKLQETYQKILTEAA